MTPHLNRWQEFDIRVNGFIYHQARIEPGRTTVLAVQDALIGVLPLDDHFLLEVDHGGAQWCRVSAGDAACAFSAAVYKRLGTELAGAGELNPIVSAFHHLDRAHRILVESNILPEVALVVPAPKAAATELIKAGFEPTEKWHTLFDPSSKCCVRLARGCGGIVTGDLSNG